MKKIIGTITMKLIGWKMDLDIKDSRKDHCVLVAAPHTSNWDLFYAMALLWRLEIPIKFLIKDFYTKNLLFGWFFRALGGIGVDRSQRNNLTDYAAQLLRENDQLSILLSPEGTRDRVDVWKSGFYKIAMKAGVPIGVAYLDAKEKKAGLKGFITPSEDYEQTLGQIREMYRDVHAVRPENWNPDFK